MISSQFDKSEGIFFATSKGKVKLEEMFDQIEKYGSDTSLPRDLLILEDASDALPEFSPEDFPVLMERISEYLPKYNSIKHAVIQLDPVNTAYSLIMGIDIRFLNYELQVFSTEQAAKAWLKMF